MENIEEIKYQFKGEFEYDLNNLVLNNSISSKLFIENTIFKVNSIIDTLDSNSTMYINSLYDITKLREEISEKDSEIDDLESENVTYENRILVLEKELKSLKNEK